MKKIKADYFLIGIGVFLLLIVIVISIIAINVSAPTQPPPPTETATSSPTIVPPNSVPPVLYSKNAQDKLLNKLENRRPISNEDAFAKAKILAILPSGVQSGIVHETSNIIIDYTASADEIQVEILTTNINQAKAEANVWLRAKGMSQQGICDLPVSFYLNWEVAEKLKGGNIIFSPLPNSC